MIENQSVSTFTLMYNVIRISFTKKVCAIDPTCISFGN